MLSKEELNGIDNHLATSHNNGCETAIIHKLMDHIRELEAENATLRASEAHKGRALGWLANASGAICDSLAGDPNKCQKSCKFTIDKKCAIDGNQAMLEFALNATKEAPNG